MKRNHSSAGKMLVRGRGASEITDIDIERRANELASIQHRAPTKADVAAARRELMGESRPPGVTEDEPSAHVAITRDPSEPPSDSGEQIPDRDEEDEEQATERLVEDGVDEAQHDQMLEARRDARREDRR
ncbi:MAG TPA: hypothetical protein VHD32_14540 [Candidatus Didemnitutus sp.]|nr:hypothetical protein [Candidatus Didemnitutus sp.]